MSAAQSSKPPRITAFQSGLLCAVPNFPVAWRSILQTLRRDEVWEVSRGQLTVPMGLAIRELWCFEGPHKAHGHRN